MHFQILDTFTNMVQSPLNAHAALKGIILYTVYEL